MMATNDPTPTDTAINPARVAYVEAHGLSTYRRKYNAGQLTSQRVGSLDRADADGRSADDAWMDGYLDDAAGREDFHLLFCQNHDECP